MPYVIRDAAGQIVSAHLKNSDQAQEHVPAGDPALAGLLGQSTQGDDSLRSSDLDLVRVIEDLIEMLAAKGVILFTDLPPSAQAKILLRKRLRQDQSSTLNLLSED